MKSILVLIAQAHAKSTPGKRSPDGKFREYSWSREISKRISEKLYLNGIKTIIINPEIEEDVKLSVQASRANKLYKQYKDQYDEIMLISPHVNAGPKNEWSSASGWCGYVYNKAGVKSRKLAKIMADLAYDKYNLKGNRYIPKTKYFEANFAILRETSMPAVLTENLFQTNIHDVAFLESENGKNIITDLHVEAILEYIKE